MRRCRSGLAGSAFVVGLLLSHVTFAREVLIEPGDTLWTIAKNTRAHEAIAIQDQMATIFRLNPHAFADNSVDSLRYGARLTLPEDGQEASESSIQKPSPKSAGQPRTVVVIRGVEKELLNIRSSL